MSGGTAVPFSGRVMKVLVFRTERGGRVSGNLVAFSKQTGISETLALSLEETNESA